jgi:tRNA pseudouridine38-40 synthase
MARYFIEVAYLGTNYSGFQAQQNANTIQAEVEKALAVYYKQKFELTGSSRTDAGVHAHQNFFHFDTDSEVHAKSVYNLNAILPNDIVVKQIFEVSDDMHCRFSALSRQYIYCLYNTKNPFLQQTAYYYPYTVNVGLLQQAADVLLKHQDFTSFSKRNTQTYTKLCNIVQSNWAYDGEKLTYTVTSNRFLRGMVRGLVGTMLLVGRKKISVQDFTQIITAKDCTKADFSTPAHGLFLAHVKF